jgi:hypothetical protein
MRNLSAFFLLALFTACGTISADRPDTAKQQVAEATAAWIAANNSRDPARITALYDPEAVFWGTSAKTIAANPAAVAEYFQGCRQNPTSESHSRRTAYSDIW